MHTMPENMVPYTNTECHFYGAIAFSIYICTILFNVCMLGVTFLWCYSLLHFFHMYYAFNCLHVSYGAWLAIDSINLTAPRFATNTIETAKSKQPKSTKKSIFSMSKNRARYRKWETSRRDTESEGLCDRPSVRARNHRSELLRRCSLLCSLFFFFWNCHCNCLAPLLLAL